MIITFYGTERSKNNAPQILAACAFETAYKMARKTLVLQFYSKYPIEDILIGKSQVTERMDVIENDETGVETLLRKSQTRGLNEEHFFTYTKPIFTGAGSKNAFDVAPVPKLADFKHEIAGRKEDVQNLLEVASNVYDNIFILADGKDEKVIQMLSELSDKQVVCVPQGNTQRVFSANADTIYVVTDFDTRSVYNVKRLKKQYDTKYLFAVPYNVNFKDAYLSNNVLKFLYENNSLEDQQNGFFVTSIRKLTTAIVGEQMTDESGITQFDLKNIPKIVSFTEKMEIKPEDVQIETKKKHFWSRKKTKVSVRKNGSDIEPELAKVEIEDAQEIMIEDTQEAVVEKQQTTVKKENADNETVAEPVKLKSTRKTTKKVAVKEPDKQVEVDTTEKQEVSKPKKTVKKEVSKDTEPVKKTTRAKKAVVEEMPVEKKEETVVKKATTVKKTTTVKKAAVAKTVKATPTATKKVVKKAEDNKKEMSAEAVSEAKAE